MFPESYVSCLNESVCAKSLVRLVAMLWTVASQSPLSMGFSRQEYWSGLPCPPPGDLPQPRDRTQVSHRQILSHQGSLKQPDPSHKYSLI